MSQEILSASKLQYPTVRTNNTTLHLPIDAPIPFEIISRIVQLRHTEHDEYLAKNPSKIIYHYDDICPIISYISENYIITMFKRRSYE